MQIRILQSGDDVTLVIPRALAEGAHLEPGAFAEACVEEGKLVVKPAPKPKYTSEQLLSGIAEKNRHDEISSGPPVGEEAW